MASLFLVGAGTLNVDGSTNRYATTSGGVASVARATSSDTVTMDANSTGTYTLTDATAFACSALTASTFAGSFNWNGKTATVTGICNISGTSTRTWIMGSASFTCGTWTATTTTGLTFTPNTSTIISNGTSVTFNGGGLTYNNVTLNGGGNNTAAGANTFATLTYTGGASKTGQFIIAANQVCTTSFTVNGNTVLNRVLVTSDSGGTQRTITAAATTITNADFTDIVGAGAASWNLSAVSGGSGDAGNNSGITFTTPATQTWSGTTGGNWSANAWTTRVPLPQDNVNLGKAWSTSQTITNDMPRLGASIDWTGATGSPTWDFSTTTYFIYGGITLIAGMSLTGTQFISFGGRTTQNVTSAGQTWPMPIFASVQTSIISLQDAFNSSNTLNAASGFVGGRIDTNGFAVTCLSYSGGFAGISNHSTSTITVTSTAATTVYAQTAVFDLVSAAQATISISTTSANTRIIALGAAFQYGTVDYSLSGSTGTLQITATGITYIGKLSFKDVTNARTLQFTSGQTFVIINRDIVGTSGKKMTVNAITAASAATIVSTRPWLVGSNSNLVSGTTGLTVAAGIDMDWLTIQDITGVDAAHLASQGVG